MSHDKLASCLSHILCFPKIQVHRNPEANEQLRKIYDWGRSVATDSKR